jgi:FAD/FMN-containing dehydrogenase
MNGQAQANTQATTQADTQADPQAHPSTAELKAALMQIVGADHVRDDEDTRELHSQDIWAAAPATVALVVSPHTVDQISAALAATSAAGFALAPRGAGMSYTGGYVPLVERTVSLDLSRMDRVLQVNERDMTVTVEAGCTWASLLDHLSPLGLRTPFWGPMSGLMSTIGGGLSQLNAMLGAGHYGTSSESVVAMTLVLSDGRILRTGARGADGNSPFYRHYGPDLAGLFFGDCGAFAVKAEITLRLIRNPPHEGYASFAFKSGATLLEAMAEMARAGVACETCAFDPGLTKVRMQRESLRSDVKKLAAVVSQQKSFVKGLMEAGRVVLAGREFIAEDDYPLHVIAEGRCAEAVEADLATVRRIAAAHSGREIENTIAKVIRAQPFPPLNSVLGPAGQRWAPIHGIAPLSQAGAVFEAVDAVFAGMKEEFEREGISVAYLFTSMSTNALIVEPVFYWPDARGPVHEAAMEPEHMARLPPLVANPKALAVVVKARESIIAVYQRFGCGHFQIGRTYPYRASRDAASWSLLEAVKRELDPAGALNPGVLGLDPSISIRA